MTIIERSAQIYDLQTDTTVETKDVVEYTNTVKETGMTPDEIEGRCRRFLFSNCSE